MSKDFFRWIVILIGVGIAGLAAFQVSAQTHEGMIYGKVHTKQNTYTGLIRWGNEEVLWTDLFNASKTADNYKNLVPEQKKESDSWLSYDWTFSSIWEDKSVIHQFTCQFGDIARITMLPRSQTRLTFKNGGEITVAGEGYNDIGANINVLDDELGIISVEWSKIEKIDFLPTPAQLKNVFGTPIYGTVEGVRREKFTGFIVWDNDERLSTDALDGSSDEGKMAIKFADISAIEKSGKGSLVTLKSGREVFLSGSNDVASGNRGVFVVVPEIGIVKFSWSAFRRVTFSAPGERPLTYKQFKVPQLLHGTVVPLEGKDATGQIIFDIDEALDFELLEGRENDVEYIIPMRNIRRVTPKNYDYSTIELTSGSTLLLGGMRDVSSKNGGVLVFEKGKKEPRYFAWKTINEIIFK